MNIQHLHESKFRVGHIACGIGAGAKGFNDAQPRIGMMQAKFECAGGIDVDAGAIRNFEKMTGVKGTVADLFSRDQYIRFHGKMPPVGWKEMMPSDLRKAFGGYNKPLDVVFASTPCLFAGGLVITQEGSKSIEDIVQGDNVLTHKGRYQKVAKTNNRMFCGKKITIEIAGSPFSTSFTDEHPIYHRLIEKTGMAMTEPKFTPAIEIKSGDRVGFPITPAKYGTAKKIIEKLVDPNRSTVNGINKDIQNGKSVHGRQNMKAVPLWEHAESETLWTLIGMYIGGGYRDKRHATYMVSICAGPEDGDAFKKATGLCNDLGLNYNVDRNDSGCNVELRIENEHLHKVVGMFGDGALNKHYPEDVFSLEDNFLTALIDGHRANDGSDHIMNGEKRWKIVSTSAQLMRDVQRALLRFKTCSSIHQRWPDREQVLGGTVNEQPHYEVVVIDSVAEQRQLMIFEDGIAWTGVCSVSQEDITAPVYNLEVDVDDTYCSPMIATHNCKGLSSLLSDAKYQSDKYSALNELTVRAIWLTLEAYKDDPVKIILFENVPRITNRGRPLLDDIQQLLAAYNYCFAETVHDCGEIGGLAQHRKRFLLVARHMGSIPNFLYEPEKKRVRGVGEVIGKLPLPGDLIAGPMHKIPRLQWKTWVRLAFVEAGKDWRSLERLRVANGVLADYTIVPDGNRRENNLGVLNWDDTARTMTTQRSPLQGRFSVADPRCDGADYNRGVLGVNNWQNATGVVAGASRPGNGNFSVADPRMQEQASNSIFRVVPLKSEPTLPETNDAESGPYVADPRPGYGENTHTNILRVRAYNETSGAITGSKHPAGGAPAVADPRIGNANAHKNVYRVAHEDEPAGTITSSGRPSNGGGAVADKRYAIPAGAKPVTTTKQADLPVLATKDGMASAVYDVIGDIHPHTLPGPDERLAARIIALDNTWHRPFTTLEAAALQSLFDPDVFAKGGKFDLESTSDAEKREWIGNAVPSDAARGMAETIGKTLILAGTGQTFTLSSDAIWCNPLELALAVNPIQDLPGEILYG